MTSGKPGWPGSDRVDLGRSLHDAGTITARKDWDWPFPAKPAEPASTPYLVGHGLAYFAYGLVLGLAILGLLIMLGLIPA